MNRIKRNGYQKILSLTLSASLLLGLTGCGAQKAEETAATAVSYTHLTLPTIA